jgi:hypothetical protein
MALDSKAFMLHGIRDIIDSYDDSPPLYETLLESTEQAVAEESPTTFELSKSLIDTTCKTILNDKGIEISNKWDTPQLFKATQDQINFLPPEHPNPQKFRSGMGRILNGLDTAINGFCELRNTDGIIAHGQDGYHQTFFFAYQVQFVARAADAVVHFLFNAHRRNLFGSRANRIYYEENHEFNAYIDEIYDGMVIAEQFFTASKILYNSDKEHSSYRETLKLWEIDVESGLITLNS